MYLIIKNNHITKIYKYKFNKKVLHIMTASAYSFKESNIRKIMKELNITNEIRNIGKVYFAET